MDIQKMTLKEYDKIPILYDGEGNFQKLNLDIGDYYLLNKPIFDIDVGSLTSVYEVIRLTETGHESKITMIRIE